MLLMSAIIEFDILGFGRTVEPANDAQLITVQPNEQS